MKFQSVLLLGASVSTAFGFSPLTSSRSGLREQGSSRFRSESSLYFGIPGFLTPQNDNDDEKKESKKEEKKMTLAGLAQLITAGAGAPFLGDFQGVDEETGKFMFSLEANNLVDENGNSKQTSMPYFESGWVDPADEERERRRKEEGFKFPWQK